MTPRNRSKGRKDWPPGLVKRPRKSGEYYYWLDPGTGKEEPLRCKNDFQTAKRRAQELNKLVAAQMADDVVNKIATQAKASGRTFKEFVPVYLKYCKDAGQRVKTLATKKSHLNPLIEWYGDRPVDSLSVKDVNKLLNHYIEQDKKWKAKHLRTNLIDLYKHARTTGDVSLEYNEPASATRAPNPKVKRSRLMLPELLPIIDQAKMLKRKPWVHNSILLALVTGQREDDLTKIRFRKLKDWDGLFKKWVESDYHEKHMP